MLPKSSKCPPRAKGQCYSEEHHWSYLQVAFSQLSISLSSPLLFWFRPPGPVLIACKQVSIPTCQALPLPSSLSSFLAPGEFPPGLLSLSGYPSVFMMRFPAELCICGKNLLSASASPDNSLEITCDSIFSLSHGSFYPHGNVVQVWPLQVHPTLPLVIDPNHPRPGFLKSSIYSHRTPVRTTPVPSFS